MKHYFGTDGIRGPYGVGLITPEGAMRVGYAAGAFFARDRAKTTVLVGRDTRASSDSLVKAITAGLQMSGADVIDVGVIPTPGLSYLTKSMQATFGIMITASHNRASDNGIKLLRGDGKKLSSSDEAAISEEIDRCTEKAPTGTQQTDTLGQKRYIDFLVNSIQTPYKKSWRLAVDCANGAASFIAKDIFERAGIEVHLLSCTPDGTNINHSCGSNDTLQLRDAVVQQKLDGGIAFDGDADRVVFIDEQGRELSGDHLLFILAQAPSMKRVVATVMSNKALRDALTAAGKEVFSSAVGDHNVLQAIKEHDAQLGGEQNGHIILPDFSATSDGMLAALQVIQIIDASKQTIAAWHDKLILVPQSLVNVPISEMSLFSAPQVNEFITHETEELGQSGRLLIRPSGTEPIARVMVESPDAELRAKDIASRLTALLNQLTPTPQSPQATVNKLESAGCSIISGPGDDLFEKLIVVSRQPHIIEQTPRDSEQRFTTIEACHAWIGEDRTIHWLIGPADALAGIIWYRPEEVDGQLTLTFAIRIYEGFVGKGLAYPFMLESLPLLHTEYANMNKPLLDITLETNDDNSAALHLYKKLGYEESKRVGHRVYMHLPVAKQQQYIAQ